MRSSENKLIHIPLTQGVNQGPSEHAAPPGTLVTCLNMRIQAGGILQKRRGSRRVVATTAFSSTHYITSDGTTIAVESPCFCSEVGSALFVGISNGEAFCLDSTLGTDLWEFQGCFSTALPVKKRYGMVSGQAGAAGSTGDGFTGANFPASAVNTSGYLLVVAVSVAGELSAYIENPAGVRIWNWVDNASFVAAKAQAVAVGTVFMLAYQVGTDIRAVSLTPGAAQVTVGSVTSVGTLTGAGAHWDTSSDGTNWYTAHQSGALQLRTQKLTTVPAVTNTANLVIVGGTVPCSIWASSLQAKVWIGFFDDPAATQVVGHAVYGTAALALVQGYTAITSGVPAGPPLFGRRTITVALGLTSAFFVCRSVATVGTPLLRGTIAGHAFNDGSTPFADSQLFTAGALPVSKPDDYQRVWCLVDCSSANFTIQKYVLLRFKQNVLAAASATQYSPTTELSSPNFEALASTFAPSTTAAAFHAQAIGTSSSFFALPVSLTKVSSIPTVRVDVYEYTTAEQRRHTDSLEIGQHTIIGGQPVEFYGQGAAQLLAAVTSSASWASGASEIGFHHAPTIGSLTDSPNAAALAIGTYTYRAVFEWPDMYGRRHRSAPSAPVTITITVASQIAVVVTSYNISQRCTANTKLVPVIHLYRTLNGGTPYHRVKLEQVAVTSAGAVTMTDAEPDGTASVAGSVAANEFIYTDGGVLQNDLAPSCRFMCKAEDRVWFGGLWDPTIVQCSKVIVPGEPIQCTDHESHQVPLLAECTGLAYMDGTVIAFCATSIYLITGDGPNEQGVGAFPSPRLFCKDIGCIDSKSIVETNGGVLFQSRLGFYLIPRGFGTPQYVGAAVRTQVASTPQVVSSAVNVSTKGHYARWLMGAANAQTATAGLCYDVNSGQWFTDSFGASLAEIGSCSSESGFAYVQSSLNSGSVTYPVWIESDSFHGDQSDDLFFGLNVTTAWIYAFGPGGWGKFNTVVMALESTTTQQSVNMRVQVDEGATQSGTFAMFAAGVSYRGLMIANRFGTALQVRLIDVNPGAPFPDIRPISLSIEIEPLGQIRALATANFEVQ